MLHNNDKTSGYPLELPLLSYRRARILKGIPVWAVRDSNPRPLACHAPRRGSEGSIVVHDRPLTWADASSAVRPRPGKFSPVATVVATRLTPCTSCNASPHHTGSLRGPSRPTPSMLAARDHARGAVRRCPSASGRRRSGALFGARSGVLDRRLECGRRHPQHRLPRAVLYALQSGQAASVLAPVAAPGIAPRGYRST